VPFVEGLRCRECARVYPAEALHVCEWCFGPLEVVYDYEAIAAHMKSTGDTRVTMEIVLRADDYAPLLYDKADEEHYNVVSAFIKSMRGSDPDAAVYWMMRMLEAGDRTAR